MKITPKELSVKKWEVDKSLLIYQGKEEQFLITPFLGAQEAVSFTDDKSFPLVLLNIRWLYNFKKRSDDSFILDYVAEDEMFVVIDENKNDNEEVVKAIRDSYARCAIKFDELKAAVRFRNGLPLLSEEFVQNLAHKIIGRIQKGRQSTPPIHHD